MQIDFSAAFDRVNHRGILYKLCSLAIVGAVLSILTQFLSNPPHHVMVNGCQSKLLNFVRSAAGKCFGPVIVPPKCTPRAFSIPENMLICYADDSTFFICCAITRR